MLEKQLSNTCCSNANSFYKDDKVNLEAIETIQKMDNSDLSGLLWVLKMEKRRF